MSALEQPGHPAALKGLHPIKEAPATQAQRRGNLGRRQLPTGGQAGGQQALLALGVLAGPQLSGQSLRYFRAVQMVSLRQA
jgi:hypothetical protein